MNLLELIGSEPSNAKKTDYEVYLWLNERTEEFLAPATIDRLVSALGDKKALDLVSKLKSIEGLRAIATREGIPSDGLEAVLDSAVASGDISQDEADDILSATVAKISRLAANGLTATPVDVVLARS
jgi:hypothetical protein